MWARVVELCVGVWLAISPFLFDVGASGFTDWDAYFCAWVVVTASCLSYWRRTRHARAATGIVGVWLAVRTYFTAAHPVPAMDQNVFLVGLILIMFAIVPNDTSQPPASWRRMAEEGPSDRLEFDRRAL